MNQMQHPQQTPSHHITVLFPKRKNSSIVNYQRTLEFAWYFMIICLHKKI